MSTESDDYRRCIGICLKQLPLDRIQVMPTQPLVSDSQDNLREVPQYRTIPSPVGPITLMANSLALLSLSWGKRTSDEMQIHATSDNANLILERTETQLKEYFNGERTTFDIPLEPQGTEFQKQVWQQLLNIPYGQHITYGEQARRLGRPKSARAVGAANGKNPIGILIPCHRVIGASGSLTGFSGGLERKSCLLNLESNTRKQENIS